MNSDGPGCFRGVTAAGCTHYPTVVTRRLPSELPAFQWIHTGLDTLKTRLCGCHEALGFGKYADSYLAAFAYRFNRRLDLAALCKRLLVTMAGCTPTASENHPG